MDAAALHPEKELLAELEALDRRLDEALGESFPASDAIALTRRETWE